MLIIHIGLALRRHNRGLGDVTLFERRWLIRGRAGRASGIVGTVGCRGGGFSRSGLEFVSSLSLAHFLSDGVPVEAEHREEEKGSNAE